MACYSTSDGIKSIAVMSEYKYLIHVTHRVERERRLPMASTCILRQAAHTQTQTHDAYTQINKGKGKVKAQLKPTMLVVN